MPSTLKLITLESGVKINAVLSHPPTSSSRQPGSPTVMFLHFWGGSANTWSLVTPLVSETYPTVALDFRGWGLSTGPDERDAYSIASLADDVEGVIAALELDAVVLVGLSMGAKVAQLVAARMSVSSERTAVLRGLVLVSPAPPTPLTLPPDMREQQLHAYDNEQSAAFVASNVLTASFKSRGLPEFVVGDMLRGNKWAKEAWPAYAMAEDISGAFGSITAPVLVLAATKDVVEPLGRVQAEVCSRFWGARLEVIPGSGHLSPLDAPEAVADHLLRFLRQV
ncbi:Alpha/Beta hydrolase protein [Achaetomium macrosporum]|uniref:Alpha/Beta hydrolase protein n=1 Tax=Achaetomium macrosporum TaxID=79813 RepID=A0AAN7H489_9PEZI|nr:Alpha/Beta hydrolase protein [Achaetomium macrosporum]